MFEHNRVYGENVTTAPILLPPFSGVDKLLAAACFLCTLVGCPANLAVLHHFSQQRKDLPTCLYMCMNVADFVTCLTVLVTGICFANNRDPSLFGVDVVCQIWGGIWVVLPFLSVYLVCVLSVSRTLSLLFPLQRLVRRRYALGSVAVYLTYLTLRIVVPVLAGSIHFVYVRTDVYCWDHGSEQGWYLWYDIGTGLLQLAAPVLPVCVSCLLSVYSLNESTLRLHMRSRSLRPDYKRVLAMSRSYRRQATITILLVTLVYIVCNLPIFGFWVLFLVEGFTVDRGSRFLSWYSWGLTYVVLVALNSLLNPLVMIGRMSRVRRGLLQSFSRTSFYRRNRVMVGGTKRGKLRGQRETGGKEIDGRTGLMNDNWRHLNYTNSHGQLTGRKSDANNQFIFPYENWGPKLRT